MRSHRARIGVLTAIAALARRSRPPARARRHRDGLARPRGDRPARPPPARARPRSRTWRWCKARGLRRRQRHRPPATSPTGRAAGEALVLEGRRGRGGRTAASSCPDHVVRPDQQAALEAFVNDTLRHRDRGDRRRAGQGRRRGGRRDRRVGDGGGAHRRRPLRALPLHSGHADRCVAADDAGPQRPRRMAARTSNRSSSVTPTGSSRVGPTLSRAAATRASTKR